MHICGDFHTVRPFGCKDMTKYKRGFFMKHRVVVSTGIDVDGNVIVIVTVDDVNVTFTLGVKPITGEFDLVLLWQN